MPFSRPTLTEERAQVASDINAALPGVDALLRYSNEAIIGEVVAGASIAHFDYLDWIARQSTPFTATDEFLEGWAALKGVTRKPATAAIGLVTFTAGTDGTVVPAGTVVNRSDGASYVSTADASSAAGTVAIPVAASTPGVAGNTAAGATMFLGSGISGIGSTGATPGALTGGVDLELDADLRSRMLAVYANPPQGGSVSDYPAWAREVPGVTRAWLSAGAMGPGTLSVLFMMDSAESAHGGFPQGTDGCSAYELRDTPATGDQLAVANYIFAKQSVVPIVYAVSPTPNVLAISITGIASASAAVKTAISTAIAEALMLDAVPGGTTNLTAIEGGVASVPGAAGGVITSITASAGTIAPASVGNIVSNVGALPALGLVTYL